MSVALARVTESALDRVAVLLPSAELLARDQQFARLRQLSAIFRDARDDLRSERPFLAVTLDAVQHHLAGRERAAERRLAQAIGFDKGAQACTTGSQMETPVI